MATDIQGIISRVKEFAEVQLAQRMSYTGDHLPEYIGEAAPGTAVTSALWRIKKLGYSGTDATSITWADGNTNFDNVWDDRATLTYS